MSETSITTPPGFDELPKAEQVRYLQALWDQISEHPDEIPVPESHLQLAEERLRRYRKNPSLGPTRLLKLSTDCPKTASEALMNK
jgi:hypothetical protein